MVSFFGAAAIGAILLDGVSGGVLRAQAAFDSCNVHVGDPMALTIDFIGDADFTSLHPPRLACEVDARTWKIDDASAKTTTYRDARRLSYRVRPLRDGLLEFPALEFAYSAPGETNAALRVKSAAVPVHAKPGDQIALAGLDADGGGAMPMPDGILCSLPADAEGSLGADGMFAWRKACSDPTPAAFAPFDFPEARLNEAACETIAGNWAKALRIYALLEWRIGQTPAVERGIVAALARKTGDPSAELPVWRRVFRPVLVFSWKGRLAVLAGLLAAIAAVAIFLRRLIRVFACLAILSAAASAHAQTADPFEIMDRNFGEMQERFRQQMQEMESAFGGAGGGAFSFGFGGEPGKPVKIKANVKPGKKSITVGEQFDFILEIETPRNCTVSDVQFIPSQTVGLKPAGSPGNLPDAVAGNTNNVVRRISVPVRYDAPFKGDVDFKVMGMYSVSTRGGRMRNSFFSNTFSSSFSVTAPPVQLEVKPLPSQGQPPDFSGAVGTNFRIVQKADRYVVETNDVVAIDWELKFDGYVPPSALPEAAIRTGDMLRGRRYFVADGRPATEPVSVVYYDTASKKYKTATARGMPVEYRAAEEDAAEKVVVNAAGGSGSKALTLRFSPRDDAPVVALVDKSAAGKSVSEEYGEWARIDDGSHAGWARKEDIR